MTLEEVIASGNGKITPYTNPGEDFSSGEKVLASQQYTAFDIPFTAYFAFRDAKLTTVYLKVKDFVYTTRLLTLLKETYGNPVDFDSKDNRACKITNASWRDQSLGNNVNYYESACSSDQLRANSRASITYQPLREPGKSGL